MVFIHDQELVRESYNPRKSRISLRGIPANHLFLHAGDDRSSVRGFVHSFFGKPAEYPVFGTIMILVNSRCSAIKEKKIFLCIKEIVKREFHG
jgi:hypothetical protein